MHKNLFKNQSGVKKNMFWRNNVEIDYADREKFFEDGVHLNQFYKPFVK